MKRTVLYSLILLIIEVLQPSATHAQGTVTYLSNLSQSSTGSLAVGSDSMIAQMFYSGSNPQGYLLNSVQLIMTDASGDPNSFTVTVYSAVEEFGGLSPGSDLGTLTGPADPAVAGTYTYNALGGLLLSDGIPYFIVLTSGSKIANGAYEWSLAGANSYNPVDGWAVTSGVSSGVLLSVNGSSWTSLSATYPQFAINATAAPEPGVTGIIFAGCLLFGLQKLVPGPRSQVPS